MRASSGELARGGTSRLSRLKVAIRIKHRALGSLDDRPALSSRACLEDGEHASAWPLSLDREQFSCHMRSQGPATQDLLPRALVKEWVDGPERKLGTDQCGPNGTTLSLFRRCHQHRRLLQLVCLSMENEAWILQSYWHALLGRCSSLLV